MCVICGQMGAEVTDVGGTLSCCHWFSIGQGRNYNKSWIYIVINECLGIDRCQTMLKTRAYAD